MDTEPLSWRTTYIYGPNLELINVTRPDGSLMTFAEQEQLLNALAERGQGDSEQPKLEMNG